MQLRSTFSRVMKTLVALGLSGVLMGASGCDGNYGMGPSDGYGYLYVTVRNISPYIAHVEGLYQGDTRRATLREGEGTKFDWYWYSSQSYSNAVLTVYVDTPSGRALLPVQSWGLSQGDRSVSCTIVLVRSYGSEQIDLRCTG